MIFYFLWLWLESALHWLDGCVCECWKKGKERTIVERFCVFNKKIYHFIAIWTIVNIPSNQGENRVPDNNKIVKKAKKTVSYVENNSQFSMQNTLK